MTSSAFQNLTPDDDPILNEIGDIMSTPVFSIDHQASVQEAAQYMHASNVGSLLVKEYDKYVGIVTETDLTREVVGKGLNAETIQVSAIMKKPIRSIDRFLPVDEANKYMSKNKIRHLAVTEEDQIVGMISVKDLVGYYARSTFRMEE
ncbi:MAG: cyclic nucleotide-binding/CBS domain-containing protein [Nitrospinaceae bacterium]